MLEAEWHWTTVIYLSDQVQVEVRKATPSYLSHQLSLTSCNILTSCFAKLNSMSRNVDISWSWSVSFSWILCMWLHIIRCLLADRSMNVTDHLPIKSDETYNCSQLFCNSSSASCLSFSFDLVKSADRCVLHASMSEVFVTWQYWIEMHFQLSSFLHWCS